MKVLILGADSSLGGILYKRLKTETDFWILGTYCEPKGDKNLIKIDVNNFIEVKTFLEHFKADVVVWCLVGEANNGLANVFNNISKSCKFIYIAANTVFDEELVKEHGNSIIVRSGDKDINELAEEIISLLKIEKVQLCSI